MTTEAELMAHYDANPDYYSPIAYPGVFSQMVSAVGVPRITPPVLDLGCGDGRLVRHLESLMAVSYVNYLGIDYSANRIALAQGWWPTLNFQTEDLNTFLDTEYDTKYGIIVAIETLEHLEDPASVIAKSRRLLRPDGVIIGTVPVDMAYEAHLQVYETKEDVVSQLHPNFLAEMGPHWILRWNA